MEGGDLGLVDRVEVREGGAAVLLVEREVGGEQAPVGVRRVELERAVEQLAGRVGVAAGAGHGGGEHLHVGVAAEPVGGARQLALREHHVPALVILEGVRVGEQPCSSSSERPSAAARSRSDAAVDAWMRSSPGASASGACRRSRASATSESACTSR